MSMIPSSYGRRSNVFDLDMWDPYDHSRALSHHMPSDSMQLSHTRIDWRETADAHVFKADMPGIKKGEVKVEVEDGNVLQISGERTREKEETSDKWHRVERSGGHFSRRFRLPENARVDEIKAAMEDGVLTITVPKEEAKANAVRSILIN